MRPQAARLAFLLASDPSLQPVIAKARDLRALKSSLVKFLPPALAQDIRACNLKDDKLVVLTATPAVAAKLKLLSEGLCKFLLQQGMKVNSVFVRVQPDAQFRRDKSPTKRAFLSPSGASHLQELHGRMADSPARSALKALLDHELVRRTRSKP